MQQHLTPDETISIIENAISETKKEKTDAAHYYVLWGSVLLAYTLLYYAGLKLEEESLIAYSWAVFPLGGLISYLLQRRSELREKSKLHTEKVYMSVWGGIAVATGIIFFFGYEGGISFLLTSMILLMGLASFITGGITRFVPSIGGGLLCMVAAGIAMRSSLDVQFLLGAAGVLSALIIPGLIMYKESSHV